MDIIEHTNLDAYEIIFQCNVQKHWVFYCNECQEVYYVSSKLNEGDVFSASDIIAKNKNSPTMRDGDTLKCPEHPWKGLVSIQIEQYPPETDDFKQLAKMLEGV